MAVRMKGSSVVKTHAWHCGIAESIQLGDLEQTLLLELRFAWLEMGAVVIPPLEFSEVW